jgi:hypothetical protein
VGGFGRFQVLLIVVFPLGIFTGGQLLNGLGFLTAMPNDGRGFLCYDSLSQMWNQCTRDFICNSELDKLNWRIDYNAPNTYHNWVDPEKLDLTCLDPIIIGLQGTSYFIGFMLSSLSVPRLSDKYYARRKPYLYSLIGCVIFYTIIYISHSIYINIFCFFCIGLCAGGRVCVGLAYMNEFMPKKY